MKRMKLFVAVALFVTLIGTISAAAQTTAATVRVKVPFEFTVGQSHFAPGTYVFTQSEGILYIRNDNAGLQKMFLTSNAIGKRNESKLLEFADRDGRMYLTKVWAHGGEQGRQLLQ